MHLRTNRKYYVYKLTCIITNKSYIGRTINLIKRLRKHLVFNSFIGNALRKYEPKNFMVEILWTTISKETANCIEKAAIKFYNTQAPDGYNLTPGGDGCSGLFGEDHPMFGKKRPDVTKRNKGNEYSKGVRHTEEWKRNQSKKKKGNKNTLGKHWNWPEESKKKIEGRKNPKLSMRNKSPENILKMRITCLKKKLKRLEDD